MTGKRSSDERLVTRGQGMTRDNYRVREGVHGEWCVDEAAFLEYRFVARAASELEARRLCAKLNGHPIPVRELEEPKGLTAQQRYRLSDEMAKRGFSLSTCVLEDVLQAASLRIVEKERE